jgi:hypothetical protein
MHSSNLSTSDSILMGENSIMLQQPKLESVVSSASEDSSFRNGSGGGNQKYQLSFEYEGQSHDGDDSEEEVDQGGGGGDGQSSLMKRRPRRSVVHLYDMVVCATGCNPLAYKGYGCYCGFLGSGLTVDGIDR